MQSDFLLKRHDISDGIIKAVSIGVLIMLVLWVRVFYGSMKDYEMGERLLKENQIIRAITYFDRSLHWYAPINPYLEKAATRLWEIGERAEKGGDLRMARIAFESIRNASYGTTHVFTPRKDWIRRAETKISELSGAEGQGKQGSNESWNPKKSPHPHPLWSLAVVLGFLGWVGCLLGLILLTFRQVGFRSGRCIVWFGFSSLCFILWLIGMAKA
jgi:hypothetical protein